jgi:RNA polymerase sigma-70 factor (ECF subfamily)
VISGRSTDQALVDRCRSGDPAAFEELYQRQAPRLYNLALRLLGNAADAEDLLQDIFLLAHRKLDSFKGDSALATWLYRLGYNLCLDHLRSKTGKMNRVTDLLDDDPPPAAATTPQATELAVSRLDLERAIGELPDGCRAAFVLHDVEGFDHQQVGDILGIAEGTSKSQVHKARLRIRAYLRR